MKWRPYISLMSFIIAALIFVLIALVIPSSTIKWAAPAIALALISVGLGVNSMIIASQIDRKISRIDAQIESLYEKIEEGQKESSSSSPIIPTIQAFSQLYLDYLAKQKSEEEQ